MKITIGKALKAGTERNFILAAILLAVSAFAAYPGLVTAQEPPQIVQYRQRIAQIDSEIAQLNNWASDSNQYWYYYNDQTWRWQYENNRQFKAQHDAIVAQNRQRARQDVAKLQNDRSWQQWGITSYYNQGGGSISVGPQTTPPQAPSTGSAGSAGGRGGLLGTGQMQR